MNVQGSVLRCAYVACATVTMVCSAVGQVIVNNLGAEEIVYDPIRNVLIASLPDQNKVVKLSPTTLGILPPEFVTTGNPTHLGMSASSNMLYVGLDTSPEVIQIDLSTWTQVRRFPLGVVPGGITPAHTYDIAVKPDDDEFIVVSLRQSSSGRGLAAYSSGLRLPNEMGSTNHAESIVFGSTPDTLYGGDTTSSQRSLRRFLVDSQGLTLGYSIISLLPSGVEHLVHADDLLYTDWRWTFHGPTAAQVGSYDARGIPMPDTNVDRVFFFESRKLMSFELSTFSFVEETQDLGFQGSVRSVARWGADGFAVATSQGYVYSLRSSLAWDQMIVLPSSVNVVRGIVLAGNGASLSSPDNDRLYMRPGVTFTSAQAPVEIELQGISPIMSPANISLSVETQGTSSAVVEKVSFYDFITGSFVAVKERPTLSQDQRVQCDVFETGHRFVHPTTGEMRARIAYKAAGPVFTFPWSVKVDLARWVLPK